MITKRSFLRLDAQTLLECLWWNRSLKESKQMLINRKVGCFLRESRKKKYIETVRNQQKFVVKKNGSLQRILSITREREREREKEREREGGREREWEEEEEERGGREEGKERRKFAERKERVKIRLKKGEDDKGMFEKRKRNQGKCTTENRQVMNYTDKFKQFLGKGWKDKHLSIDWFFLIARQLN